MDLIAKICAGESNFRNEVFEGDLDFNGIQPFDPKYLRFERCTFLGSLIFLNINLEKLNLLFSDCSFKKEVEIESCKLLMLNFSNVREIKDIYIRSLMVDQIKFNSSYNLNGDITIYNICTKTLDFSNINNLEGKLSVSVNTLDNNLEIRTRFMKSSLKNLDLYGNLGDTNFENLKIYSSAHFIGVNFKESYFNNANFGKKTVFNDCVFNNTISFSNSGSEETNLSFEVCLFKGHSYFREARFNSLVISDSTFEARASFDTLEVNYIKLYLVTFQKMVFFDELRINKVLREEHGKTINTKEARLWRRTLRQIKQELQKTDNKIDYNKFKYYELHAYYRELNWQWNDNFKDKLILGATILFTGFENSWRRALGITLLFAVAFYSLFFISENYMFSIYLSQWQEFLSGYFRFLIVTDFYNPLSEGRSYIDNSNTIGWFIFILGKIVIAFGIYEMIQAFRKFKA